MNSGFKIVFALWFLVLVNYLDRSAMSFAGPTIMAELGMTPTQFGMVLSSFGVGYALALVPGGLIADRWGTRLILVAAPAFWGIFTGLTGFVTSLLGFASVRLLLGLSEGLFSPSIYKTVGDHFEPKRRAGVLALCLSALALGPAIAGPTVGFLTAHYGWAAMFMMLAVPALIASLGTYWLIPAQPRSIATNDVIAKSDDVEPLRRVLRRRSLWLLALSNMATDIAQWGFLGWMPSYLVLERHIDIKAAGLVGSIPYVFAFIGLLLGGWFGSTLLHRFRVHMVTFCYLTTAVSLFVAYRAEDLASALAWLSSTAFFLFGAGATKGAIAIDLAPERARGAYVGVYNVAGQIGGGSAPVIIGYLVTATGTFAAGFGFMTGALFAAAGCMIALMPSIRRASRTPIATLGKTGNVRLQDEHIRRVTQR